VETFRRKGQHRGEDDITSIAGLWLISEVGKIGIRKVEDGEDISSPRDAV